MVLVQRPRRSTSVATAFRRVVVWAYHAAGTGTKLAEHIFPANTPIYKIHRSLYGKNSGPDLRYTVQVVKTRIQKVGGIVIEKNTSKVIHEGTFHCNWF